MTDTPEEKPKRLKFPGRGWAVWAILWAILLGWLYFPPSPEWVDRYYSRGFYRIVETFLTTLNRWAPFSLTLVLIITGALVFLGLWIYHYRRLRSTSRLRGVFWGFRWMLWLWPVIGLWFLVAWGAGYQRTPAEIRLHLDMAPVRPAESQEIREKLLEIMRKDQPTSDVRDVNHAIAAIADAMRATVREWDGRDIRIPHGVKATPAGMLMMNGTSGICTPFLDEPHVDGGLPDTSFVYTAAHELGHIAGMCKEDEAELIGFVSGLRANDPYARYAEALDLYLDLVNQLPRAEAKTAFDAMPETAKKDVERSRAAHNKYVVKWFQNWSWRAYNKYLQSQGIKEGTKNYARGVQLFVFVWRKGDLPLTP